MNLANINDLKACLIIQEKVCAESAELTILCEKNNFSYSGNLSDVNDYAFYLILNKEYDKALNKLNESICWPINSKWAALKNDKKIEINKFLL